MYAELLLPPLLAHPARPTLSVGSGWSAARGDTARNQTHLTRACSQQHGSSTPGWRETLSSLNTLMWTLLVFFLGFHINDVKARFMDTKAALLSVGGAIESMMLLWATILPGDEHIGTRERFRRHCMNLYQLLWVSSNYLRPSDGACHLEVNQVEQAMLDASPKPSITVTMWLLEALEPLRSDPDLFVLALGEIRLLEQRYNAVLRAAYNQMPFPYVHLIGGLNDGHACAHRGRLG